MRLSVVVPIFNGSRYLPAFFQSLAAALPLGAELIFVDDGSTEPVLESVPDFPSAATVIKLRNDKNFGYSAAVNRGFAECNGDFVVQLNTDLILDPNCISSMLELIENRPNVGIVGSKLQFPTTGLIQHIGMAFGEYNMKHIYYQLPATHPLCCKTRPMQILTGATVAMTRQVLQQIGPLDERYFNACEDIDHCLKTIKLGLTNYTCADSKAFHWESQSGSSRFAKVSESDAIFWSTWQGQYKVDLGDFVREALQFVLDRESSLSLMPFECINLCRTNRDDLILLAEAQHFWPKIADDVHQYHQYNNPEYKYWLPMILPHWFLHNPKPFIYLVDEFQQLKENKLWFDNRLKLVREEIIIDSCGSAITVSELLEGGLK